MALPSGFGIMELFPGILSNPPAFSYFQTGAGGLINQFITEATGSPRLVYSLVSGSGAPLNYITGLNSDFYFGQGRMLIGDSIPPAASRLQSGAFTAFWNGGNGMPSYNGLLLTQGNSSANSGSPAINLRETANVAFPTEFTIHIGDKVRSKSNLGNYTSTTLPGNIVYFAANCYTGSDFRLPNAAGATEQESFMGWTYGMSDGAQNLYSYFSIYNDYVEIGKHKASDLKYGLEGDAALVLRNATVTPQGNYHASGTTFYGTSDSHLHIISSSGVHGELFPGISGVNKLATSNDIYETLNYGGGTTFNVNMSHDGKKLVDTKTGSHTIFFDSSLLNDGFSCQIIHKSSNIPLFDTNFSSNQLLFGSREGGISKVTICSGYLFIDTTDKPRQIYLKARDFYPRLTSGAVTGMFETPTYKINYPTLDFDQSITKYAQTDVVLPIDCSQFRAQFIWTAPSGAGNVRWGIKNLVMDDWEPLDVSMSSAQYVVDSKFSTSGTHKTSFTSGFIPGGIGEIENLAVKLEVFRDASNVLDTLNADAKLLGVLLIPQ